MAIKAPPLLGQRPQLTVDSLQEAAAVAKRLAGPLRVWRQTATEQQELFYYREFVIHAQAGALLGLAGVRAMLSRHLGPFTLELGRWPVRHTMLIGWRGALEAARRPLHRHRPAPPSAARYTDDAEATPGLRTQLR